MPISTKKKQMQRQARAEEFRSGKTTIPRPPGGGSISSRMPRPNGRI